MVGGYANYADIWSPLIGIYNIHTGTFTDLTNKFIGELGATTWYLSGVAKNSSLFLIVGVLDTDSGLEPALASYNLNTGTFIKLSSEIP